MRSKSEQASAAGVLRRGAILRFLVALVVAGAPPAYAGWDQTRAAIETCLGQPDGTPCDDGDACTDADACTAGSCQGRAITCSAPDACHRAGVCDPATGTCTSPEIRCEDGDPCTLDTCTADGCVHEPTTGFAAVACLLPEAGLEIAPCAGERMPRSISVRYAQGRRLVGRAAQSGRIEQSRQLMGKAARVLQGAARQVATASTHGRLSPACADVLGATLEKAAGVALQLATPP